MAPIIPYYCSHSKCQKVRFIAAPFGYGPNVAAETMARLLNIHINEWQISSLSSSKKKYKVTLNFGVARPINEPETSCSVWIDCLMWLRKNIPQDVLDYDLFLAENFFDTNPILFNSVPKSRVNEINPLYSLNESSSIHNSNDKQMQEGHILISFGGIETPFTQEVHRYAIPKVVLESIIFASRRLNDKRKIICCLPLNIYERFCNNPAFTEIHFCSPNHSSLISLLKTASIYIVQPGLYGPFEAFENNIPTVFTIPFSYTQVCQAKAYEKNNLAGYIPMWSSLKNEIGNLSGDFDNEQEYCFKRLATWFETNINNKFLNACFDWAENVLRNNIISDDIINQRKQYVIKRKIINNDFLCKIQKNIL